MVLAPFAYDKLTGRAPASLALTVNTTRAPALENPLSAMPLLVTPPEKKLLAAA